MGDGTDFVSIDELVEGCLRLKGGARSVDVNMVLLNIRKIHHQVRHLQKKSQQQFDLMNKMAHFRVAEAGIHATSTLRTTLSPRFLKKDSQDSHGVVENLA